MAETGVHRVRRDIAGADKARPTMVLLVSLVVILAAQVDVARAGAAAHPQAGGYWVLTGSPVVPITEHTATLLPSGKVLVAGGNNYAPDDAQLYAPSWGRAGITGAM